MPPKKLIFPASDTPLEQVEDLGRPRTAHLHLDCWKFVHRVIDPETGLFWVQKGFHGTEISDRDRAGIKREMTLTKSLAEKNPHIPYCGGLRETSHETSFLQANIAGNSLENYIEKSNYPLFHVLWVGKEVSRILKTAHAEGVIHRDLKPENIILGINENPLNQRRAHAPRIHIADWGAAQKLPVPAEEIVSPYGTVNYVAPEAIICNKHTQTSRGQVMQDPKTQRYFLVHPQNDIFSLGVILYRMATRELPFGERDAYAKEITPRSINDFGIAFPEDLDTVIQTMLSRAMEERYTRIEDVNANIRSLLKTTDRDLLRSPLIAPETLEPEMDDLEDIDTPDKDDDEWEKLVAQYCE